MKQNRFLCAKGLLKPEYTNIKMKCARDLNQRFTRDIENDITSNNNCYDNERVID